jgi:hypothetical protein
LAVATPNPHLPTPAPKAQQSQAESCDRHPRAAWRINNKASEIINRSGWLCFFAIQLYVLE